MSAREDYRSIRCSHAYAYRLQSGEVSPLVGKSFYVFISVMNLFLISMFWSFLLEIFDAGQSKRLFGFAAAAAPALALALALAP
jgi:AAA family ATP:ADP antiporter